jgi:hypothetical protein
MAVGKRPANWGYSCPGAVANAKTGGFVARQQFAETNGAVDCDAVDGVHEVPFIVSLSDVTFWKGRVESRRLVLACARHSCESEANSCECRCESDFISNDDVFSVVTKMRE